MFLRMSRRGAITIPKQIRQSLGDEIVFEVIQRPDGVIELRPQSEADVSQAWFWTEPWQQMEREADEDIATGRVRAFNSLEDMIAELER